MVQAQARTFVVDNGAYCLKVGMAGISEPKIIPNCIVKAKHDKRRVYIGDQLSECQDRSSLFFVLPFEKGYLVNWDVEQQVWERAFQDVTNPQETRIVLSDSNYLIPAIKDLSSEIIFEEMEFDSLFKSSATGFCALGSQSCVVVDCGFSFTTVAPLINEKPVLEAVLRIDIGGKALTNQLKDWISYRELNVMEETFVVNEAKEDGCFVSMDFNRDMEIARLKGSVNTIRREYVLPDFVNQQRGFLRIPSKEKDAAQYLTMNHERFTLPEALFRPSDVGVDQMGVVEAVVEAVGRCPENTRAALLRNVVLVGGSSKFPGFRERFARDLASSVPVEWGCEFAPVSDAQTHAWHTASEHFGSGDHSDRFITRTEWAEHGDVIEKKKFATFL